MNLRELPRITTPGLPNPADTDQVRVNLQLSDIAKQLYARDADKEVRLRAIEDTRSGVSKTTVQNMITGFSLTGHTHVHSTLTSLGADDHTQYLLANGTRQLTADWNAGAFAITADDFVIPDQSLGAPTYSTIKDFCNSFSSAGRKTGGDITDAGSSYIAVAAGTGYIKATDDDNAQIMNFDWPAPANIAIPASSSRFIGVEYNGGSPRVVARTTWNWDLDTEFPLGSVISESVNGVQALHIINNPWWVADGITNIIERLRGFGRVLKDENADGLLISVPGTRNIAVTDGVLWSNLNEFPIDAIDTSVSGTFEYYWYSSTGGWQVSDVAQYSVTEYNDVTQATLQTLLPVKYACIWLFVEADDTEIAVFYPQNYYSTAAAAAEEGIPTLLPEHVLYNGICLGRIIIKQGTDAPVSVESAFTTPLSLSVLTSHNNLSGLQGGTTDEYYHLTSAQYSALHPAVTLAADSGLSLSTQTLAMGTPGSLSNSTTNAVTGATHTHAVSGFALSTAISGTQNYLAKFGATGATVVNSQVIDDATNVGIGAAPSANMQLHLQRANAAQNLTIDQYSTTIAPRFQMRRSRNNTLGTLTATVDADVMGGLYFYGVKSDNSAHGLAAFMAVTQVGSAGATYMPAQISFTVGNGTALVEALRCTEAGVTYVPTQLMIGDTKTPSVAATSALLELVKGASAAVGLSVSSFNTSTDTNYPTINFQKSYNNTVGTLTATVTTTRIGQFNFQGVNSSNIRRGAAAFVCDQDGAAGDYVPGKLSFLTFSAAGVLNTCMVFKPDGSVQLPNNSQKMYFGATQQSSIMDNSTNTVFTRESAGSFRFIATALSDAELRLTSSIANSTDKIARITTSQYAAGNTTGVSLIYAISDSTTNIINIGGGNIYDYAATAIGLWTGATTTTGVGTQRVWVASDGKVGIGSAATTRLFEVRNTGAGLSGSIGIVGSNTGIGRLWFADTDAVDIANINYNHSTDVMAFRVNAADRLTLFSTGNISINNSTDSGYRLDVTGKMRGYIEDSVTDTYTTMLTLKHDSTGTVVDGSFGTGIAFEFEVVGHGADSAHYLWATTTGLRVDAGFYAGDLYGGSLRMGNGAWDDHYTISWYEVGGQARHVIDSGVFTFEGGNVWLNTDGRSLLFGATATDYTIQWDGSDAVHTITAGDFVFTGGNMGVGIAAPASRIHAYIEDDTTFSDVPLLTLSHYVNFDGNTTAGIKFEAERASCVEGTDISGILNFGSYQNWASVQTERFYFSKSVNMEDALYFKDPTKGFYNQYIYCADANHLDIHAEDSIDLHADRIEFNSDNLDITLAFLTTGNNGQISWDQSESMFVVSNKLSTSEAYYVDGVQVVSNRVIDARCDDAIDSGDATTDGVIDSLRDAMIAHGLIAAA